MPADEIPADVWTSISSHLILPKHHIVLSHICQASRGVYTSEGKWKQMLRSMGIGRSSAEGEKEWKDIFWEVIRHRRMCRIPQCFQYGAPAMNCIGDLLPTPEAALEHMQYFKDKASSCSCGHCSSDEEEDEEDEWTDSGEDKEDGDSDSDEEDDEDAEEDPDSDEDDDGEEASDSEDDDEPDWSEYANMNPLELFPDAPNALMAAALQESMMAIMNPLGIHPPPLPSTKSKTKSKKSPKSKKVPKIKSNLLPLFWRNRKNVPPAPRLHPYLAQTGSVQFQRFLSGAVALQARTTHVDVMPSLPTGINWSDAVDTKGFKRNFDLTALRGHALLQRAFVSSLHVDIDDNGEGFSVEVSNPNGVTLRDTVLALGAYFAAPMSLEEKVERCANYPHPKCFLDRFKARIGYLLKDHPAPPQIDGLKNEIRECWYRGLVRMEKGEVHIELAQAL